MSMSWVTATDENGIDYHGFLDGGTVNHEDESRGDVWVFVNKPGGFGDNVGSLALHKLKPLGDGKYGA